MKEFIDKLISRLEEHKTKAFVTGITNRPYEFGACKAMDDAVKIVNQLAEEYRQDLDKNSQGWISCSERLPEEKENPITHDYMQYPVMVNIGGTLDLRYYYFGNGHWRLGFRIMDEYVTHWMDIAPYQPKGCEKKLTTCAECEDAPCELAPPVQRKGD